VRPRIIDWLDHFFNVGFFNYVIPDPAYMYAIMIGIMAWLFISRCAKVNLSKYHATGITIWGTIAALVGARMFFLIQNADLIMQDPAMLLEINGATVSFGAYLGAIIGILAYAKIYRIPVLNYLDVLVSAAGVGPLLGRIGCFLNGDDFGKVSRVPWAVRYPAGSYPFMDHVQKGLIASTAKLSLPVHPVQLYGSLKGLLLLILFTWLWQKNFFRPGVLFLLFWIAYPIARFTLEFFRGDDNRGWVGPLSTGQFMSVCIFSISLLCLLQLSFKGKILNKTVPA